MILPCLGLLGSFFASLAAAESTFTPARPPAVPLAVRSPYFSTWLNAGSEGGNGGYLPGAWPTFWAGQPIGWTGLIRVDGDAFAWMGAPLNIKTANQVALEYTSTKSIFTIEVDGKVSMNVTFLSPVTPNDFKRQSLTMSYVNVEVWSTDGQDHDVQLYTDISAEWVSGDRSDVAQWDFGTENGVAYHRVSREVPMLFSEERDQGEWGTVYYATDSDDGLTFQSGGDNDVRGAFAKEGKLANSKDNNYRAINSNWPVFGYSIELGTVDDVPASTLFSIGLLQHEAIQFLGEGDLRTLNSLWMSYFKSDLEAVTWFHLDFEESSKLSNDVDIKIAKDSLAAAGQDYLTLTSLATRQAFGAVQLVGTLEKPYLFLKEISSNGNTQTVDVIFPASPIFFHLNPELVKLLMDPHYENQESGHYPNKYAIHDLGTHYPNATGHPDGNDEPMPLEECGNMMAMTLSYVQRTRNTDYIKQHYPLLKQWADFLVADSLYPNHQLSTDDFAGPLENQTNLALKGMIGLEAMAEMSRLIGEDADAKNYSSIAHDYIEQWMELGTNKEADPPHTVLTYNNRSTHGILYNLYNDRLLNLGLVPEEIYTQQSEFYPTQADKYGVPLDTRHHYTKGDWEIFAAAVASEETRDMFIQMLAKWVEETPTSRPFTDLYEADTGKNPSGIYFMARPVMGGMFALLALP